MTKHFTLEEFEYSDTAKSTNITNKVPPDLMINLQKTCECAEIIRELLGVPMKITSGYRNDKLNAIVGGRPYSDHKKCLAFDFKPQGRDLNQCFEMIKSKKFPFIRYTYIAKTFIHISIKK